MSNFYNWSKTLTYDADVTMVVGARGIGKTYGLRKQFIKDYIKNEYRFVEVCRYKNELISVANGYFSRVQNEYPDYLFKTNGTIAYIAKKPKEKAKPEWEIIGYFVALSQAQQLKKQTFNNVKRICFDEAILDKNDRYHFYLKNEYIVLANVIDTVSRERVGANSIKPRLYLLGNACNLLNPYFVAYNIEDIPKEGFSWHANKTMLLDFVKDSEYAKDKLEHTVAGRMLANVNSGEISANNEFIDINKDYIYKKTKISKFEFGIVYRGDKFGVWLDNNEGYYYISDKIPNNTIKPIYSISVKDNKINYIAAGRMAKELKYFMSLWNYGIIRYESVPLKEKFVDTLAAFGIQ